MRRRYTRIFILLRVFVMGSVAVVSGQRSGAAQPHEQQNMRLIGHHGLLYYWPNRQDNWRRVAFYLDKILNGANPADLPVQRPTKYDFIINLKTAKALGITIPKLVLY